MYQTILIALFETVELDDRLARHHLVTFVHIEDPQTQVVRQGDDDDQKGVGRLSPEAYPRGRGPLASAELHRGDHVRLAAHLERSDVAYLTFEYRAEEGLE